MSYGEFGWFIAKLGCSLLFTSVWLGMLWLIWTS